MSPVPNLVQVPAPAPATTLPSYGEELMQMIFVLGALVALLYVALRYAPALRSRLPGNAQQATKPRRMSVVERLPIGPRRALLLVRLNDREILLSSTEQGVQAIETQDRQQRAPLRLSEPASLASNSGAAHNEIEEAS